MLGGGEGNETKLRSPRTLTCVGFFDEAPVLYPLGGCLPLSKSRLHPLPCSHCWGMCDSDPQDNGPASVSPSRYTEDLSSQGASPPAWGLWAEAGTEFPSPQPPASRSLLQAELLDEPLKPRDLGKTV